jgi:hypothetical protein
MGHTSSSGGLGETSHRVGPGGEGSISGPIDPIRVDCNPNAKPATVHAIGIIKLGSTPVIVVFQATQAGFTLYVPPSLTTKQHFFIDTGPCGRHDLIDRGPCLWIGDGGRNDEHGPGER